MSKVAIGERREVWCWRSLGRGAVGMGTVEERVYRRE